jgi:hypothetical protein
VEKWTEQEDDEITKAMRADLLQVSLARGTRTSVNTSTNRFAPYGYTKCAPFHQWPNVDNGVTCGGCQALVKTEPYHSCDHYCQSFGHYCVSAAEEADDNCKEKGRYKCHDDIRQITASSHPTGYPTSDMLCTCIRPDFDDPSQKGGLPSGASGAYGCWHDTNSFEGFGAYDIIDDDASSRKGITVAACRDWCRERPDCACTVQYHCGQGYVDKTWPICAHGYVDGQCWRRTYCDYSASQKNAEGFTMCNFNLG